MNIQSAITQGAQILKDKFCLNPYLDSEILMSKAINKDKKYLILNSEEKIEEINLNLFQKLIKVDIYTVKESQKRSFTMLILLVLTGCLVRLFKLYNAKCPADRPDEKHTLGGISYLSACAIDNSEYTEVSRQRLSSSVLREK